MGESHITVAAVAECPFAIAEEYAKEYLENAEAGHAEAYVRVPLFWPLASPARRVRLTFGIHADVTEPGRSHTQLRLRWSSGTRLLPNLHGTLAFRIEGTRTRIVINGCYVPPFGTCGRVFDRIVGRRLATASLNNLAERIARYLAERERAWRSATFAGGEHDGPRDRSGIGDSEPRQTV
jgi:hypothetical protein